MQVNPKLTYYPYSHSAFYYFTLFLAQQKPQLLLTIAKAYFILIKNYRKQKEEEYFSLASIRSSSSEPNPNGFVLTYTLMIRLFLEIWLKADADAIFIGEAEYTLPEFIQNFIDGKIKPRYECTQIPDLKGVNFSKKELFHRGDFSNGIMTATRICPNSCEFCALTVLCSQLEIA